MSAHRTHYSRGKTYRRRRLFSRQVDLEMYNTKDIVRGLSSICVLPIQRTIGRQGSHHLVVLELIYLRLRYDALPTSDVPRLS